MSFLARDVIYTSRAYAVMPVRLSVMEVHWHIIANLGFKFQSHFTAHCGHHAAVAAMLLAMLLAGESSRTMLANARLSCYCLLYCGDTFIIGIAKFSSDKKEGRSKSGKPWTIKSGGLES